MGHAIDREQYRSGGSLKLYHEELLKIVYPVRSSYRPTRRSARAIVDSLAFFASISASRRSKIGR
jgi:hypothetical protein